MLYCCKFQGAGAGRYPGNKASRWYIQGEQNEAGRRVVGDGGLMGTDYSIAALGESLSISSLQKHAGECPTEAKRLAGGGSCCATVCAQTGDSAMLLSGSNGRKEQRAHVTLQVYQGLESQMHQYRASLLRTQRTSIKNIIFAAHA